jgi:hypothetical protein
MNRLFLAAETAALGSATATADSTSKANRSIFRRYFKNLHFRTTSRQNAGPATSVDSQLINEKDWKPDKHQSALYDLTASNPHVIAISLFSRKHR